MAFVALRHQSRRENGEMACVLSEKGNLKFKACKLCILIFIRIPLQTVYLYS